MNNCEIKIPIRLYSPNVSEHWRVRHKRNSLHSMLVRNALKTRANALYLPCIVTLTRIGSKMLDDDNVAFCFKSVRDTVADLLIPGLAPGQADGDPRITWRYDQRIGSPYAIEIAIDHNHTTG